MTDSRAEHRRRPHGAPCGPGAAAPSPPRTAPGAELRQLPRSRAPPTACSSIAASPSRTRRRLVPYLERARHQPLLLPRPICKARPGSTPRLRHHRPQCPQSRDRQHARTSSASSRHLRRASHGADPRHGAEPHGRHGQRQRLVAGRAGERARRPLRRVLRHRLAAANPATAGQGAAAGARRSLRQRAENGELQLGFDAKRGALCVYYYEHRFPVDPATLSAASSVTGIERLEAGARARSIPTLSEFQSLMTAFGNLPPRTRHVRQRRHRARPRQGDPQAAPGRPVRTPAPTSPGTSRSRARIQRDARRTG